MTLRSYKMTHLGDPDISDKGKLILSCCIGNLRKHCKKDEWVAGFTSKAFDKSEKGEEKLIYLAKIEYKNKDNKVFFDEFYDFKEEPLLLKNIRQTIRIPYGRGYCANKLTDENFIDFVRQNKHKCFKFKDDKGKLGGILNTNIQKPCPNTAKTKSCTNAKRNCGGKRI